MDSILWNELDSSLKPTQDLGNRLCHWTRSSSVLWLFLHQYVQLYNVMNILYIMLFVLSLCFRISRRSMGEEILEGRKCWCVDEVAVQWDADPSICPLLTCLYKWVIWDFKNINNIFTPNICPVHLDCKFLRDIQVFPYGSRQKWKLNDQTWIALHLPKLDLQECGLQQPTNHTLGNNFIHQEMPKLGITYSNSWDFKECQIHLHDYDQTNQQIHQQL